MGSRWFYRSFYRFETGGDVFAVAVVELVESMQNLADVRGRVRLGAQVEAGVKDEPALGVVNEVGRDRHAWCRRGRRGGTRLGS